MKTCSCHWLLNNKKCKKKKKSSTYIYFFTFFVVQQPVALACSANDEDTDQLENLHSLIGIFAVGCLLESLISILNETFLTSSSLKLSWLV